MIEVIAIRGDFNCLAVKDGNAVKFVFSDGLEIPVENELLVISAITKAAFFHCSGSELLFGPEAYEEQPDGSYIQRKSYGGAGSGHRGHKGIPGHVGGSAPDAGGSAGEITEILLKTPAQIIGEDYLTQFHAYLKGEAKSLFPLSADMKLLIRSRSNIDEKYGTFSPAEGPMRTVMEEHFKGTEFEHLHSTLWAAWTGSSNTPAGAILKDSAARIFGGENRHHDAIRDFRKEVRDAHKLLEVNEDQCDRYVKSIYAMSQQHLDVLYPRRDNVTLYRGTSLLEASHVGKSIKVLQNPLSSWSSKKEVAKKFELMVGGRIMKAEIPKKDIWTTFICYSFSGAEREHIVLGKSEPRVVDVIK